MSTEASKERFARPMTVAPGIVSQTWGWNALKAGADTLRFDSRYQDAPAGVWADQAQDVSAFNQPIEYVSSLQFADSRLLDQQSHGDIKGFDTRFVGQDQLQGVQDLSQNQCQPQLNQDQLLVGNLPQRHPTSHLRVLKASSLFPSASVQLPDLLHGQLFWVQYIGDVLIFDPRNGALYQVHRISGSISPIGT